MNDSFLTLDHTVSKLLENIQDEDDQIQQVSLRYAGEEAEEVPGETKLNEIVAGTDTLSLMLNNQPFSLKVSAQKPKDVVSFSVKSLEQQAVFSTMARHLRDAAGNKMSYREFANLASQVYGLSVEDSSKLLQQLMSSGLVLYLPSVFNDVYMHVSKNNSICLFFLIDSYI